MSVDGQDSGREYCAANDRAITWDVRVLRDLSRLSVVKDSNRGECKEIHKIAGKVATAGS